MGKKWFFSTFETTWYFQWSTALTKILIQLILSEILHTTRHRDSPGSVNIFFVEMTFKRFESSATITRGENNLSKSLEKKKQTHTAT